MTCQICGNALVGMRSDARYCSVFCKYKANRNTTKLAEYAESVEGRTKTMWHNSRARNEI